jgi:integrase
MARAVNRLTAIGVARTKRPGYHADGAGLYLRVGPTGAKSWTFRYRSQGRLHDVGLGPLHTVTLAEARVKALELRKQRLAGEDPLEVKRAKRQQQRLDAAKTMTFRECAARYIAAHKAGWGRKSVEQWTASLETYANPILGDLPVQTVDVAFIMRVIEPLWADKTETASRVRGRIESVLDWATVRGYRKGDNPARWRGHLDHLLPKQSKVRRVEHRAALPYAEIGDFMVKLRARKAISARALEFAILTAARTGEVIGARWDEIDFADRVWVIPSERMKMVREHRVPLSQAAIDLLTPLAEFRQCDFVFPGAGAGESIERSTMRMLLMRIMGNNETTVHGFRSTFRDWAAERTNFPREVVEMALAHAIESAVEAAYRRGDLFEKRRELADEWARYLTGTD